VSIDVQALTVRAGSSTLVDNVSFAIEPGTWCTLIGPNGAGKTSLVETIVGLRRASSGDVTIHGRSVAHLSERERARTVAFVPQNPVVPAGMTVATYVGLGRTAYHGVLRSAGATDRAIVSSVLERVGLVAMADRDVASLSGGERQRTVLARALAQSTLVLVLDEPTTGLDVRHQIELLELVRTEVRECGLTVLATLHDLTLATQFADRLTLLADGRVVDDGMPAAVVRGGALVKSYGLSFDVVTVDGADVVVPLRVRDASVH
jgi:iron complex transport system ATP-binding protein